MDKAIRDRYNDAILREAMARYDIPAGQIEESDGFESYIYRFTRAGERFILRITHSLRRTPELIRGEVDWINYLAAGGASVARAVLSARGELVETIDDGQGGRFLATAFAYAPGRPPWETGWSPALYETYGRLIGRMHALTKAYAPADPAWRRADWLESWTDEVIGLLPPGETAARERYLALAARVGRLPRGRDEYGLIHFDAHSANFHVDGDAITLFDFDDCAYNWFAADLAIVVFYMITNAAAPEALAAGFLPPFLRGYAAENRLHPRWLATLPEFMTMREIDLYAVIHRSYGAAAAEPETLPHDWTRRFMVGRRARIEAGLPYVDFDFTTLGSYLL